MAKPLTKENRPTKKEESFAKAYILSQEEPIEAYRKSEYSQNLTPEQMSVQANKLLKKPRIRLRIDELMAEADRIAKESFTITVKQRLEWLKEITEAGLGTFKDNAGNRRRESLTAARSAIETMNTMLGVSDDDSENAKPLTISFQVSAPVKEIKVTNANT